MCIYMHARACVCVCVCVCVYVYMYIYILVLGVSLCQLLAYLKADLVEVRLCVCSRSAVAKSISKAAVT